MSSGPFGKLHEQIKELQARVDAIEAASRLAANTEQPLVGPPEKSNGRPAALARPAILAELKTFLEGRREVAETIFPIEARIMVDVELNTIFQELGKLDQGTAAKCPSEESTRKKWLFAHQKD
jgi:hypothetical protein